MRNLLAGIMLILFISQCTSTKPPDNPINKDSSEKSAQEPKNEPSDGFNSQQIPDFLNLLKNSTEGGKFSLQGVSHSDSTGPYILEQFFSDSLDFDLLFYPKNGDKNAVDFDAIEKAKSN